MVISSLVYKVFSSGLLGGALASLGVGLGLVLNSVSLVVEWDVWGIMGSSMSMSLLFDWMSVFFLSVVCMISGCVMKYSECYMEGEKNYSRFIFILFTFVVSMWLLIISPNLISLLLGWDGLGLSSYALVIFYQSESSCSAGMLTILSNRVGDVGILLGVGLSMGQGDWSFYWSTGDSWVSVSFLVLLASATKSAQMPFSAWLPAAMAAPTPVSALVHSSTLVTAGVYLLIRFSEVVDKSGVSGVIMGVSAMTMVMAGLGALYESDMKKVVALSTLSQLGLMILVLGAGLKELAFFHLITHAMFKSTLFMCAGSMIHSAGGSQDSRSMGGLEVSSPLLSVIFSATNLSLCGFPFLAGFYSKDALLEEVFSSSSNAWVVLMAAAGTGLTVAYSFRVLYLSSSSEATSGSATSLGDVSSTEVKSMGVLFLASVFMGFLMSWVVVPSVFPAAMADLEKVLVVCFSVVGGLTMFESLQKNSVVSSWGLKKVELFLSSMWHTPFLSAKGPMGLSMGSGGGAIKLMDSGWLEYYGGQGGRAQFSVISAWLQGGQESAMVGSYFVSLILGAGVITLLV
nr:TPA_asm: ND5 [Marinogammarus marinus]